MDNGYDNEDSEIKLKLLKRFNFDPNLQRMSVIVKNDYENRYYWFAKGSPEAVYDMCSIKSLPEKYFDKQHKYSQHGFRIIALCYKDIDCNNDEAAKLLTRKDEASNFTFLGFIIFANRLKAITKGTIDQLHQGGVDTTMATGDNALTAINVAKRCNIILSEDCYYLDMHEDTSSNQKVMKLECYKIKTKQDAKDQVIREQDDDQDTEDGDIIQQDMLRSESQSQSQRDYNSNERVVSDERPYHVHSDDSNSGNLDELMESQDYVEITITGKAFEYIMAKRETGEQIYNHDAKAILKKVIKFGKVYARMSPDQKA